MGFSNSISDIYHIWLVLSYALRSARGIIFFKEKKLYVLFYIYKFYFVNLIYKWIKKFEN